MTQYEYLILKAEDLFHPSNHPRSYEEVRRYLKLFASSPSKKDDYFWGLVLQKMVADGVLGCEKGLRIYYLSEDQMLKAEQRAEAKLKYARERAERDFQKILEK